MSRLASACKCGDCYHPAFGPNTDGDPCDWCQDCGCASTDHTALVQRAAETNESGTP